RAGGTEDRDAGQEQPLGGVEEVVAGRGERGDGGVGRCRARRVHGQPAGRGAGEHTDPQPGGRVHGRRGGEGPRRGGGGPPRGRGVAGRRARGGRGGGEPAGGVHP